MLQIGTRIPFIRSDATRETLIVLHGVIEAFDYMAAQYVVMPDGETKPVLVSPLQIAWARYQLAKMAT